MSASTFAPARLRAVASRLLAVTLAGGGLVTGCSLPRPESAAGAAAAAGTWSFVPASDPRLQVTGALRPVALPDGAIRLDRELEQPGRGFRWDSPGTRLRWRTDSAGTRVRLRYTARHTAAARNSIGVFRIDGRGEPHWTFTRPAAGDAELVLEFPIPGGGGPHDYEVILPYGDSVELLGVDVRPGAAILPPAPRPSVRYLAFGDSITHGFTASDITRTYAFRLAERKGWELVNLGFGGRGALGADGAFLADQAADLVSVLIGVNDWQGGTPPDAFRRECATLLAGVRRIPGVRRITVITPLWVPPAWQPAGAVYPLERYREVLRSVAAAAGDERLQVIEGPALIDHDPARFDAVAVHPNDDGFAQMAQRLAEVMP